MPSSSSYFHCPKESHALSVHIRMRMEANVVCSPWAKQGWEQAYFPVLVLKSAPTPGKPLLPEAKTINYPIQSKH